MTDPHYWVTTELQPPIESSILFCLPPHPTEVIRLDKEGFHYRGQFIQDAGEAHRLMVEFLRQGTVHAKAEQPVAPTDKELQEMWFGSEWLNEGTTLWEFIRIARAVLARWGQS